MSVKEKIDSWIKPDLNGNIAILIIVGVILIFGLVMLSSASSAMAYLKFGDSYYFAKRQLMWFIPGILAFLFTSKIDYHLWRRFSPFMLVASIFLLLLVFLPWFQADWGSARSWIQIFGLSFQPSELVKITFILYLAAWLERRRDRLDKESIWPFATIFGIIILLMVLQPDIGTLSIISVTALSVYYVGGGKLSHIITITLVGIIGLFLLISVKDYQKERLLCYQNPDYDPQDTCYQINQSLIAVGSGGLFGRGLGESRQKFLYLPEVTGDSIFPIIAEETGFVFSSLLVIMFAILAFIGWRIATNAPDHFGQITAIGIVTWLTFQAIINIGGAINLIPMTGVPLPLVSYGGSALMASLSAAGILYNISKSNNRSYPSYRS